MKKPWTDRFGDFMAGKGFYIVLFLCVAAIGVSGYYLFSSLAEGSDLAVSAPARVVVTPTPSPSPDVTVTPVRPSVPPTRPTPKPVPSPSAPATPSVTPAPSVSPSAAPSPKNVVATVYTWPVKGDIVDAYSPDAQRRDVTMGDWRTHAGVDIAAEIGVPVKAAGAGTVVGISSDDLLGTTLTLDHGSGVKSVYANLAELPAVAEGDSVDAGEIIGAVGATAKGESEQLPHLHLAFYKNGAPADPMDYLPKQ